MTTETQTEISTEATPKVHTFKKRKDKVAEILTALTDIIGVGDFNLNITIVSQKDMSFKLNICENLRAFLNLLVVKTTDGKINRGQTEYFNSTTYQRYRVNEAVFAGNKTEDMAFLFEKTLIETGTSIVFNVPSMSLAMTTKDKLCESIKQIVDNLIAYTELEKDTAIKFGFEVESSTEE